MISKDIVQRTVQALEDYIDLAPEDECAALAELLNFWRLYNIFSTKEEA